MKLMAIAIGNQRGKYLWPRSISLDDTAHQPNRHANVTGAMHHRNTQALDIGRPIENSRSV